MDELEADIQRRLNLIKESLAKLDDPIPEITTKSGGYICYEHYTSVKNY